MAAPQNPGTPAPATNGAASTPVGTGGVVGAPKPPAAKEVSWGEYVKLHPPDLADDAAEEQSGEGDVAAPLDAPPPAALPSDQERPRDDKGRFLPQDETEKAKAEAKPPKPKAPKPPKEKAPEPEPEVEGRGPASAETITRARALLAKGDLVGAHVLVFGSKPEQFGIDSKQWAAWRSKNKEERSKLAARERHLESVATQVKEYYAPYAEAEELLAKGDVEGWVKKATRGKFGYNDLAKRALKQYTEEPASVKELRERADRLERKLAEREEQDARRESDAQERRRDTEAYEAFVGALQAHDDPRIVKLSRKPAFVAEVIKRVGDAWNQYGDELDPGDVASEVFAEEFGELFEDSPVGASAPNGGTVGKASGAHHSAVSKQTGAVATPARRTERSTTLPLSEAAEVSAPIPVKDSPERDRFLREKYTRLMRNSTPTE